MSFFGGNNQWGGLLKQAISNVETTFDTLLEQSEHPPNNNPDEETETYVDPISGMVTTVAKKKKVAGNTSPATPKSTPRSRPSTPQSVASATSSPSILPRQQSDLSARLAAVMNEKKARSSTSSSRPASVHSTTSSLENSSTPSPATQVTNDPEKDGDATGTIDQKEQQQSKTQSTDDDGEASLTNVKDDNSNAQLPPPLGKDNEELDLSSGKTDTLDTSETKDTEKTDPTDSVKSPEIETAATVTNEVDVLKEVDPLRDTSIDLGVTNSTTDTSNIVIPAPISSSATKSASSSKHAETDLPAITNSSSTDNQNSLDNITNSTSLETATERSDNKVPTSPKSSSNNNDDDDDGTISLPLTTGDIDKDRILAQREQQLLQSMETIAKLHDQIHSLQESGDQSTTLIKSLQNQLAEKSTSQGSSKNIKKYELTIQDLNKQLGAKEEQIQGLLQEGEKLSKNELKQATTIKRLRTEKQDQDKSLADLQKKLDKINADLIDAATKSKRSSENEKRAKGRKKKNHFLSIIYPVSF
ncbi:uncharacterized protein BX664DRAFT_23516 [Halteromyces radiatus]|uniref:uncharacterized protein n=1 Tax=Halteromyces radiatus TaxID=101107 RepID=UPI0022208267|nr:uncharacterized protein BX664DRAFT_23516 [Halteromyces radiatus]KAI8099541.1 hypothetical protein BX664DRAFT_23516 [Halteromyces radiatus]